MPRRGFKWNLSTTYSRLSVYVDNTEVARFDDVDPYITALNGLTVTTGGLINTAGDHRITAGNYRLGAVSAFGTTQPTSAMVFKVGTAPVGAITTSSGLFTDGTNMMKIIADGTADNVET